MTEKQKKFCNEYMVDLNATQAAIRAGYSPKSANQTAAENMAKPSIRACIDRKIAEQSKRTGVTADRVVRELAKIAFVDPSQVINSNDATVYPDASSDDTAAIAGVKVKTSETDSGSTVEREVKLADKTKALELLGRHLGMFNDKVDIKHEPSKKLIDIIGQLKKDV